MKRSFCLGIPVVLPALVIACVRGNSQTASQPVAPVIIQQAQTIYLPIQAIQHETALPVKDLKPEDLTLDIDGKPCSFQLSRPWSRTINPRTGQPDDKPNLLIVLPLGDPEPREFALEQAIHYLQTQPQLGWNISILDDGGEQTPYTRDMKTTVDNLEKIESEGPAAIDLDSWRRTAALAIASMRELQGRRIVLSLGDIFHEMIFEYDRLVYENFELLDVAAAARSAGATIYSAESSPDIERFRNMAPRYSAIGPGPWLIAMEDGRPAGWIADTVEGTMRQIRQDGMGAYDLGLHLELNQMNGRPRSVSVTPRRKQILVSAPLFYVAPDLAQLQQLSRLSPALLRALQGPPSPVSAPLELATQLEYFPHADGKSGTQVIATGFFWNGKTAPPAQLNTALELKQTSVGYIGATATGQLQWNVREPVWTDTAKVVPGAYNMRVAAADAQGKIVAATNTSFNVDPSNGEPVLISSLVLGKSCIYAPQPNIAAATAAKRGVDYLRAGNCDVRPDPSHYYSPQDMIWTLVRITPVGKLAGRPPKDWKASFLIVDMKGSKIAEEPVRWLTAEDGSFIATTVFELANQKRKLENGEYAVVFRLKGPGVEPGYAEDAPFMMYGADAPSRH